MIRIHLTTKQRQELYPLFMQIRKANSNGDRCSIAAQIWEDGLVADIMINEKHDALSEALGGSNTVAFSSSERIKK